MITLVKGIIVGLAVAAPVGPIALLCIHYALSRGFRIALLAGLGAALADLLFGLIAGLGITSISDTLYIYQDLFCFAGGVLLVAMGLGIYRDAGKLPDHLMPTHSGSLQAFATTFSLTLANPLTLLAFAAIFGCMAVFPEECGSSQVLTLLAGIFMGSMIWWTTLSGTVSLLRTKIRKDVLVFTRKLAGVLIALFGAGIAVRPFFKL